MSPRRAGIPVLFRHVPSTSNIPKVCNYAKPKTTVPQIRAATGISLVNKLFLGRPWRVLARVIYQNSDLSNVVHPEGYTTMAANATP